MARKKLIRGMGSLAKVSTCKHGEAARCKCKWITRWRDINGDQQWRTFDDHDVAYDFLFQEYTEKRQGTGRSPKAKGPAPTFEKYATEWLEEMINLQPTSRRGYWTRLKAHAFPRIGKVLISKITKAQIKRMIEGMNNGDDKTYRRKPVYPGTTEILVKYVMAPIFRKAIADGWRTDNPAEGHRLLPVPKTKRYIPSIEEIHAIADLIDPFYRLMIYLMAGAGLREGEALGLTADVRKKPNRMWIYRQWHGGGRWGPLKYCEEGEGRWVPVDPILAAELERHIAAYGIKEGEPLFPSPELPEVPIYRNTFDRALREAVCKLGLEKAKITAHNFRHAYASHAIADGTPLEDISRVLGHKSYDTTYKTYYQMIDPSWDRMERKINGFLSQGLPEGSELVGVNAFGGDRRGEIEELVTKLAGLGVRVTVEDLTSAT